MPSYLGYSINIRSPEKKKKKKRHKTFVLKHCHFHIKPAFIARLNGKNQKQHKAKTILELCVNCNKLGENGSVSRDFYFV